MYNIIYYVIIIFIIIKGKIKSSIIDVNRGRELGGLIPLGPSQALLKIF